MDRPFRVRESGNVESLTTTFQSGQTYAGMVATAKSQADLFAHFRGRAAAAPEYLARIERTGRRWHLLAVSEDWCGDSVNILPWVDALDAGSPLVELRIIERDQHLDLMDQHLTNGRSRSIPIVILLDDRFVERAWWGPRALEMQQWFETPEAQALSKDARYKELRIRYSRDRGRAILDEITAMIEFAASQDAAPGTAQVTSATKSEPAIVTAAP
ncbi:MAG: thioredoxin family protein [Gemmatimonadetes bacterium]|nr:thioredoxin family protein [Gemmatimonadota bacterium]